MKRKYGLKSLLLLTFLAAVPCAIVGPALWNFRIVRNAASKIEVAGGRVMFNVTLNSTRVLPDSEFAWQVPEPHWSKGILGVDVWAKPGAVSTGRTASDSDLQGLARLKDVTTLMLESEQVSDRILQQVEQLTNLRALLLDDTTFSADALQELKVLPSLEFLVLRGRNADLSFLLAAMHLEGVTDLVVDSNECGEEAIMQLGKMLELQRLVLKKTELTAANCAVIEQLKNLRTLVLSDMQTSELSALDFAKLPALERLGLHNTEIAESTLKAIAGLDALEWLDLTESGATSAGVAHLASCRSLTSLMLTLNEDLPLASAEELKRQLAGCSILCHQAGVPLFFEAGVTSNQ